MAHARRRFEHALENNKAFAAHALTEIQKFYAIERAYRETGLT
jgi:transposase